MKVRSQMTHRDARFIFEEMKVKGIRSLFSLRFTEALNDQLRDNLSGILTTYTANK